MKHALIALLTLVALPAFGATCKINEYANMVVDDMGRVTPVGQEPAVATQEVTYTTSTQSAAFNDSTRFIAIVCDAVAHFVVGTDPTAAATDFYIPADTIYVIGIEAPASDYEIAFYDGSS